MASNTQPHPGMISNDLLCRALEAIPESVIVTDAAQHIVAVNRAFTVLTGYDPDELIGRNCRMLQGPGTDASTVESMHQAIHACRIFRGCVLNYRKDGSTFWNAMTITPLRDADGRIIHFVSVQRDETDERQICDELRQQSVRDPLTGLPNRTALAQHLPLAIARARRDHKILAVGILDLDDFKPVNDTCGHAAGDVLLREFAQRLRAQLRAVDFVARLGGDEFLVVLEGLDGPKVTEQLAVLARRIHVAVETPFEIMPAQFADVGVSMGLALYPTEGEEPDALMRRADAILYDAKRHKGDRVRWWQFGADRMAQSRQDAIGPATELDPYGTEAAALLAPIQEPLAGIVEQFAREFYAEIHQRRESSAILDQLSPEEFGHLKESQAEHLRQILDPALSADAHQTQALRIGEIHALVGLDASEMILAMQDYTSLVHRSIQSLAWRADRRAELAGIVGERLKHEMRAEFEGMRRVEQARQGVLAHMESQADAWSGDRQLFPKAMQTLLHHLHGLSGINYGEPDVDSKIAPLITAGCVDAYLADLAQAGIEPFFLADEPALRQCSTMQTWLTGRIATLANYRTQPQFSRITAITARHGIRSSASLPIFDLQGNSVSVITLFGRYPCQFESWSAQLWLRSLQQFFQRHVGSRTQRTPAVSPTERERFRRLLHGGGLQMLVQPLIDLYTGRLVKVEALARLHDAGEWIAPRRFLQICGDHDLAHLFREGLSQVLRSMTRWDTDGLHVDVSINLPPAVLLMPECVSWVHKALEAAGVEPHRLILELLETEEIEDPSLRDTAVRRLADLGVQLGMDDLGAGYSGLQRLQTLPFQIVKIDQGAVRQVLETPDKSIPFLGALVRMTQAMGMRVTVEGLESAELLEMAVCLGADWGQGYAIARPMPRDDLFGWAVDWRWPVDPDRPMHPLGKHALAVRQESVSLDWKQVVKSHERWGEVLVNSFRGQGKPLNWRVICRDDKCQLGRWLYRHRSSCMPAMQPVYERAMAAHAQFHRTAGDLVRRVQHDADVAGALAAMQDGELASQSADLVELLRVLSAGGEATLKMLPATSDKAES